MGSRPDSRLMNGELGILEKARTQTETKSWHQKSVEREKGENKEQSKLRDWSLTLMRRAERSQGSHAAPAQSPACDLGSCKGPTPASHAFLWTRPSAKTRVPLVTN